MRAPLRTIETDVCVVGAGLVGLAHAFEARRRGLSVVVLERDPRALGASIGGLGHLFFSALAAGAALDGAESARERWLELGRRCGILSDGRGTVIVARRDQELSVLEAAASQPARQARLLTAAEVGSLAPLPLRGVRGGFHGRGDLRIDPRTAAARLSRLLERDPHARIEWDAPVHGFEPGIVHSQSLRVRAAAVVICAGAERGLTRSPSEELRNIRLQLLRVAPPTGRRYRPVVVSGAGLLGYPGFAQQPGAGELRARLELECPESVERGVRLRVAQLPGGDLLVGDTQAYIEVADPFTSEPADRLLLDALRELIGVRPQVRQRWQATYAVTPFGTEEFLVDEPCAGVRVVRAAGELALAVCHLRAGELLDELCFGVRRGTAAVPQDRTDLGDRQSEYVTVHDLRQAGGLRAHADVFRRLR